MIVPFVRYDEIGMIVEIGNMPEDALDYARNQLGQRYLEGNGTFEDYVDLLSLTILPRPIFDFEDTYTIVADGIDALTLVLPMQNADLSINNTLVRITDGEVVFTATHPGVYTLVLTSFPYLPKTITVTANAPKT